MRDLARWIVEPGYRSEEASWVPSLLLAGVAFVASLALESVGAFDRKFDLSRNIIAITYLLIAGSVVLRRHYPGIMMVISTLACLVQVGLLAPGPSVLVLQIVYDYARWTKRRSRVILGAGLLGAVLGPAAWLNSPYFPAQEPFPAVFYSVLVVSCAAVIVAAYVTARFARAGDDRLRERRESEIERARHAIAEREQRARTAEANARNRIARELHDIVAHSLSVIAVQAAGGRALAHRHPERATEVLTTIGDTSREALDEMRRIVGVLRSGPEAAEAPDYRPTPTLAEIGEMVARAGNQFRYTVRGTAPDQASQSVQLAAYRIVQEAITNVLKHAGPQARAEVVVDYRHDAIELSIIDDGYGAAADNDFRGHGLRGMQERVLAMGGRLHTGPGIDRGFSVRAVLPLRADGPTATEDPASSDQPSAVRPPSARSTSARSTSATLADATTSGREQQPDRSGGQLRPTDNHKAIRPGLSAGR